MNTYGLSLDFAISVPSTAFPLSDDVSRFAKSCRKVFLDVLRVQNVALQIFGFLPILSVYSGMYRICAAGVMFTAGAVLDLKQIEPKLADDLRISSISQIFRGILEMLFPVGRWINLGLDITNAFALYDDKDKRHRSNPPLQPAPSPQQSQPSQPQPQPPELQSQPPLPQPQQPESQQPNPAQAQPLAPVQQPVVETPS